MKNRRELLKMLPFLAAIPFIRIPNDDSVIRGWRSYPVHQTVTLPQEAPARVESKTYWAGTTIPRNQRLPYHIKTTCRQFLLNETSAVVRLGGRDYLKTIREFADGSSIVSYASL